MSLAFVFPGQGSQSIGMMSALGEVSPVIEATFAEASAVLGYDLWQRCQEGPRGIAQLDRVHSAGDVDGRCRDLSPVARARRPVPTLMAGHSLGEFTALGGGRLPWTSRRAVDLVRYRGELMQAAVPPGEGAMAAILGLEDIDVEAACQRSLAGRGGRGRQFQRARPGGDRGKRRRPSRARSKSPTAKGARRALALPISVPAHSSLMQPAAEQLRMRLESTAFAPPSQASPSTAST